MVLSIVYVLIIKTLVTPMGLKCGGNAEVSSSSKPRWHVSYLALSFVGTGVLLALSIIIRGYLFTLQ